MPRCMTAAEAAIEMRYVNIFDYLYSLEPLQLGQSNNLYLMAQQEYKSVIVTTLY